MKCIVLAAGYATRLYPLTADFPKPLLKIQHKTILDWLLDDLRANGVRDFVVISNHRFAHHFQNWAEADTIVLDDGTTSNENRLGAVRDIQFAIESLSLHEDLLVIAGDNLLDFSLAGFLAYAGQKGTSCVMRYHEPSESRLHRCGVLTIDADEKIIAMEEKPAIPQSHWCCPPFYFYTREDAARVEEAIAAGCGTDAPGSLLAWLCKRSPVYAMLMPGNRYDIGTVETYEKAQHIYKGITIC